MLVLKKDFSNEELKSLNYTLDVKVLYQADQLLDISQLPDNAEDSITKVGFRLVYPFQSVVYKLETTKDDVTTMASGILFRALCLSKGALEVEFIKEVIETNSISSTPSTSSLIVYSKTVLFCTKEAEIKKILKITNPQADKVLITNRSFSPLILDILAKIFVIGSGEANSDIMEIENNFKDNILQRIDLELTKKRAQRGKFY